MSSPSTVRSAVPQDQPEIWRLFRLHARENALFPVSDRKVQTLLDRILHPERIAPEDDGPRGLIGVIGPTGALEAGIMLVLGSPWYTDKIVLEDGMTFVDPAHRQTNHAHSLIAYAKHLVDQARVAHDNFCMIAGIVSTKRTAAKVRLYSRQMEPIGAFFVYPSISGTQPLKNAHRMS